MPGATMVYQPEELAEWLAITHRQRAKDEQFLEQLRAYFLPGTIVEIGAGPGALSGILQARGHDVVPTDLAQFFVDHMRKSGLNARKADALRLSDSITAPVPNLLTQGCSTIVTAKLDLVEQTYRSALSVLTCPGRFAVILPIPDDLNYYCHPRVHPGIAKRVGFRVIAHFRHQVFPSMLYGKLPRFVTRNVELIVGRLCGRRHVLILEKTAHA